MKIYLNDLLFFGFHGLYEGERKIGNQFKIDIEIDFTPNVERVAALEQTIDYVHVYNMVKGIMDTPTPLLETLVDIIATKILEEHSIAEKVFVKITKQKLFIESFQGKTAVSTVRSR